VRGVGAGIGQNRSQMNTDGGLVEKALFAARRVERLYYLLGTNVINEHERITYGGLCADWRDCGMRGQTGIIICMG
jgi:hypothetical protein